MQFTCRSNKQNLISKDAIISVRNQRIYSICPRDGRQQGEHFQTVDGSAWIDECGLWLPNGRSITLLDPVSLKVLKEVPRKVSLSERWHAFKLWFSNLFIVEPSEKGAVLCETEHPGIWIRVEH